MLEAIGPRDAGGHRAAQCWRPAGRALLEALPLMRTYDACVKMRMPTTTVSLADPIAMVVTKAQMPD